MFFNTDSNNLAGGVGIYLAEELNFINRCDLELSSEGVRSRWIAIVCKKDQNVVKRLRLPTPA